MLSCAIVLGHLFQIALLKINHTFSVGSRSGLQASQSSSHTLFLLSHDVVICAESDCLDDKCMKIPGEVVVLKAAYVALKFQCTVLTFTAIRGVNNNVSSGTRDHVCPASACTFDLYALKFFFSPQFS